MLDATAFQSETTLVLVTATPRKNSFHKMFHGNRNANAKYHNEAKEFDSYFLTFDGGTHLEIMCKSGIDKLQQDDRLGGAHIANSLGSRESVNQMTTRLQNDGYCLVKGS